jgi:cytoskeletal protein RodZ
MDNKQKSGSFIWYVLVALIIVGVAVWGLSMTQDANQPTGADNAAETAPTEVADDFPANEEEEAVEVDTVDTAAETAPTGVEDDEQVVDDFPANEEEEAVEVDTVDTVDETATQ